MSDTVQPSPSFIDKLGFIGEIGDQVVVPVLDEDDMPQLAIATVVDIVRRPPSPFAPVACPPASLRPGPSVRTRSGDDESCIYEPEEIVVLVRAVPALDQRTAAPSTKTTAQ